MPDFITWIPAILIAIGERAEGDAGQFVELLEKEKETQPSDQRPPVAPLSE
jgi:hypothetical protein